MTYAQTALDREVGYEPVSNTRVENLRTTRVIFFAGDAIPAHEKYEMPDIKGFGGIYLPHVRTLPQGRTNGSRGMVYQCKFTPLKTTRRSEWKNMLPPEAREHWDSAFIVTENGQRKTVTGFRGSNLLAAKKGEFVSEVSDHLVHKEVFPGDDVRVATTRSVPNGIGGVVEITALLGATDAEIREVQLFFFPNWDALEAGVESLPSTIDGVEAHIKSRIAAIPNEVSDVQKYQDIGREMLRSCSEYRRTGTQIIEKDDVALKAAAKDDSQVHSPVSGLLLDTLQIKRKGELLQGDHNAVNKLAEIMAAKESSEDKHLRLKEQELYLKKIEMGFERDEAEEIRLGLKKVSAPQDSGISNRTAMGEAEYQAAKDAQVELEAAIAEKTVADITTETVTNGMKLCGKPTANGTCGREIDALADGCWQHS